MEVVIKRKANNNKLLVVEIGYNPSDVQSRIVEESLEEHISELMKEIEEDDRLIHLETKNLGNEEGVLVMAYSKGLRKTVSHYAFILNRTK